ncbi:DUF397 domain-containing protein [Streptomyces sp. O3]
MRTKHDLTAATWRKSSYSGGDGGDCVEIGGDFTGAALRWRKSTYSGGDGGECLEVADGHPGVIPVRDSKNPHGPALVFRARAWSAFVADVSGRPR